MSPVISLDEVEHRCDTETTTPRDQMAGRRVWLCRCGHVTVETDADGEEVLAITVRGDDAGQEADVDHGTGPVR